jgi:hypothetical protein
MSKIHVLEANGDYYRIVLHFNIPGGSNTAGVSWQNVMATVQTGSVLPEGTGPGEISTAELASIVAGTVGEHIANLRLKSGGTTTANLNALVDKVINDHLAALQVRYEYYGFTQ